MNVIYYSMVTDVAYYLQNTSRWDISAEHEIRVGQLSHF